MQEWWMCMINQFMMLKYIFNGSRSISEMSIQFLLLSFKSSRISMKWPRLRFTWNKWYLKMTFKNSWSSRRRSFLIIQLLSTNLWSTWRTSRNAILLSMLRKNTSSTLKNKESSLSTRHGASIFRIKEDNCTIL